MSKGIFSKLGEKLKALPMPRHLGFTSFIFLPILMLISRIPLVKKAGDAVAKRGTGYLKKQIQIYEAETSPKIAELPSIEEWLNHQHLQALLDENGDDEPIENYYVNGVLVLPVELQEGIARDTEEAEQAYQAEVYEPEEYYIVRTNPYRISVQSPDEALQKGRWRGLRSITYEIDDSGPIEMDIWVSIVTDDGTCRYPDGAQGSREVMDQMFKLRGFDHELFIKAMACTERKDFVVWKRG